MAEQIALGNVVRMSEGAVPVSTGGHDPTQPVSLSHLLGQPAGKGSSASSLGVIRCHHAGPRRPLNS